jgi:hypothetical protein
LHCRHDEKALFVVEVQDDSNVVRGVVGREREERETHCAAEDSDPAET